MPIFLTQPQLYRLLQRELPPSDEHGNSVYADGSASAYYATADNWANAGVLADAYANLEVVWNNLFPLSADERISDWELTCFGQPAPPGLTLEQRQLRVAQKLRTRQNLSKTVMATITLGAVPAIGSGNIEVVAWSCSDGSWMLDYSELDISTILNGSNQVDATGPNLCDEDPSEYGKTDAEWAIAQQEGNTYEVRIYNYTLSADEYTLIDTALSAGEKGGSTHVITSGLTDADRIDGST